MGYWVRLPHEVKDSLPEFRSEVSSHQKLVLGVWMNEADSMKAKWQGRKFTRKKFKELRNVVSKLSYQTSSDTDRGQDPIQAIEILIICTSHFANSITYTTSC